jgi:hypothetical protein
MNSPYHTAWNYWCKNWWWLIWAIFFLTGSLAMYLTQTFGARWVDIVQGLINFLTSPCMTIFIAFPIAIAILGVILGAIKK